MRYAVLLGALSGTAILVPLGAALREAPARPAPTEVTAAADSGAGRAVRYRGLRVPVPDGWEVHRLDRDPTRCVRYDRRAIYLGRPGPRPDCPARVVGRTSAVHIAPLGPPDAAGRSSRTVVRAGGLAGFTVEPSVRRETRLALPEAGVEITGVYGADPARLQAVLRGVRLDPSRSGEGTPATERRRTGSEPPAAAGGGESAADPVRQPPWTRGRGFDTCTAPPLGTMRRWRSAFEVTNIYIGGAARGCAQPNLTGAWVREVREMGYRITPTYVGLQAPCGPRPQRFTRRNAEAEGRKAAVDAARDAKRLGIPPGAPVYLDMEAYDSGKDGCRKAVLDFVDAWVRELDDQGYRPCMYSSSASGVRDVARADGIRKPEGIWFADWNGVADVYGDPHFPDDLWSPHRRIKQFRGPHKERHGGRTLTIDSNAVDGFVY